MTTTRAFKNLRLLTHFFTLLIIICNILLAIYFITETRFFQVESSLNLGIFDMQVCMKYTIIISVMMALFSVCSITSKVKFYMKLYLIVGFVGICFLMAFLVFMMGPYISIFETQFPFQYGLNISIRYQVRMQLKCGENLDNDCIDVAKKKVRFIKNIYFMFATISFFLNLIVYLTTRVAMYVDITDRSSRVVPRIEENVRMGYDAESLRTKRFVDPNVRFSATIVNTSN